ncbi:MAG: hypothetical protein LC126_29505 [Bryobacterales bacterium]|nr:hypothetical protein [Bryobacterales bacterium]
MKRFPAILLLASFPLLSAGQWEDCRSGPFEIWTNGSDRDARQLLVRFEQVRYMLGKLLGNQEPASLWPVRVLAMKGKQVSATEWVLGREAWVSLAPAGTAPSRQWMRQVARMLLESNARRMPRYWEDGLEDLLSTLEAQGPKITFGLPPPPAERTLDWARVQYLATNPDYAVRFRVLLNNMQQGADEDSAYRNSLGLGKAGLEAQIRKYFDAGQFPPATLSGRPIVEKDFVMHPLEESRVTAAIADATGNPKLSPAGSMESAEALGLEAARKGDKAKAFEWLKQAIAAGSKSARVYLAYGKLADGFQARQDAYVEAAKKNPRWAEPYIELANLEKTPERQAFYLKTAAKLNPRDGGLWLRLARAQLEAKQFTDASKSWFAAEMAAPTPEERAAVSEARRKFEVEIADREAAERKRIADERQRELERLKEQALNEVKAAETKANQSLKPLDSGQKVEQWWDDKTAKERISGQLQKVDCLGKSARIWILPAGGKLMSLWIPDPGQIVVIGNGEASLGCGVQRPARNCTVDYKPRKDARQGTLGEVAVIEFR